MSGSQQSSGQTDQKWAWVERVLGAQRPRRGAVIGDNRGQRVAPPPTPPQQPWQPAPTGVQPVARGPMLGGARALAARIQQFDDTPADQLVETVQTLSDDDIVGLFGSKGIKNGSAAKIVAALENDRGRLARLSERVASNGIAEVSDVGTALRSNTNHTAFLAAAGRGGRGGDYLEEACAGMLDLLAHAPEKPSEAAVSPDKMAETDPLKQTQIINRTVRTCEALVKRLIADLEVAPLPAEITRACAVMSADSQGRGFDERQARILVGGQVFLRLINPYLVDLIKTLRNPVDQRLVVMVTKIMQNLANDVPFAKEPEWKPFVGIFFPSLRDAVGAFLDRVVACGQQAQGLLAVQPGLDTDDLFDVITAAKSSDTLLARMFKDPSEGDPLGTDPADPHSLLGNALAQAAMLRDRSYNVEDLRERPDFAQMVHDERREVLELVSV
jgi:hypothetical protein